MEMFTKTQKAQSDNIYEKEVKSQDIRKNEISYDYL